MSHLSQSIILLLVVNIEISGLLNPCEHIGETLQKCLKWRTSLQASEQHIYCQAAEPISMAKFKTEVAQVIDGGHHPDCPTHRASFLVCLAEGRN